MDKESDIFQEEYAVGSSTNTLSKPAKTKEEEKPQIQTVTGQKDYDKSKPYRVTIRAQEIKE
jgi:hypothetical protein